MSLRMKPSGASLEAEVAVINTGICTKVTSVYESQPVLAS